MEATPFQRYHLLIPARVLSSNVRKHSSLLCEANGHPEVHHDHPEPCNVQLAMLQYVGHWPLILNHVVKRGKELVINLIDSNR
jgi:hypothetical protein